MRSVVVASSLPLVPFTPLCFLALTSCAQGMTSRTAVDVLSSVVLAGAPSGSRGGSGAVPSAPRVIATAEDDFGVGVKCGATSPRTGFVPTAFLRYRDAQEELFLARVTTD